MNTQNINIRINLNLPRSRNTSSSAFYDTASLLKQTLLIDLAVQFHHTVTLNQPLFHHCRMTCKCGGINTCLSALKYKISHGLNGMKMISLEWWCVDTNICLCNMCSRRVVFVSSDVFVYIAD
jgi:hypothetical protein